MKRLLLGLLFLACNRQGEILGSSSVVKPASTCALTCRTVEDCKRIPARGFESFQWLSCDNGICVDVACTSDAQCPAPLGGCGVDCQARACTKKADCDYDFIDTYCLNGHCAGRDIKCVQNTCAIQCVDKGDCDQRDECISGRCIRQPEKSDPDCASKCAAICQMYCPGPTCDACNNGCAQSCQCTTNAECDEWQSCRINQCATYTPDEGSTAQGRACTDDAMCAHKYFFQDMLEAGLNSGTINSVDACGVNCESDAALQTTFNSCGAGFVCKHFTTAQPVFGGFGAPGPMTHDRASCFPDACVNTCTSSLSDCHDDSECTTKGEHCVWPKPQCFGVCVNTECDACSKWTATHRTRACVTAKAASVSIDVRRPD